jgi:hypothetical protein
MFPVILLLALTFVALLYVAYLLWPRWPAAPVAPDAPTLPIVVGGVAFNIPPGALRMPVQRRAGAQERVDLAFQWPSLTPPDPQAKLPGERLFVSIAVASAALPPTDRLKVVYPRYADPAAQPAPDGLVQYAFRDGTPYQGEDLVVAAAAPEKFALRCARERSPQAPATCLYDRRIGEADITVRFPRAWLERWRAIADGIDRLIGQLRPPAT